MQRTNLKRSTYAGFSISPFTTQGTSRKIKSRQLMSRGLLKLQTVATKMTQRELSELNQLQNHAAFQHTIGTTIEAERKALKELAKQNAPKTLVEQKRNNALIAQKRRKITELTKLLNHTTPQSATIKATIEAERKAIEELLNKNRVKTIMEQKRRDIPELKELQARGAPKEVIEQKLARINSLAERIEVRMKHNLAQNVRLMDQDPEFPMLLNKDSFFGNLKKRISKSGNHSLVYMDIDKLKRVNYYFGRATGGMGFLTANARAFAKVVPKLKGLAGHLGGDEFMFYFPMAPKNVEAIMRSYLEDVRRQEIQNWKQQNVQKWKQLEKGRKLKSSLSYSAGIIRLSQGENIVRAEQAADWLCKYAKKQGRGKLTFSIRENLADFEAELKQRVKRNR